jgi:hypothetical protein
MARLLIKTPGLQYQLMELKLGPNRVGRSPDSDFQLLHPTISSLHAELVLSESGVVLRDLESTNGTFVNGQPVREVQLAAGQTVHFGDVELFVETTEARVEIPEILNAELSATGVSMPVDPSNCRRHPQVPATYQCTVCKETMCDGCVHRLRRKNGKITLLLCPICSNGVELIGAKKPKKKSIFSRVGETVKMKFTRVLPLSGGKR